MSKVLLFLLSKFPSAPHQHGISSRKKEIEEKTLPPKENTHSPPFSSIYSPFQSHFFSLKQKEEKEKKEKRKKKKHR